MDSLYIPSGVKLESDFFPGFGKKQLIQALTGFLIMACLTAVIYLFSKSVSTTVVLLLLSAIGSVMATSKGDGNQSIVDITGHLIRFSKSQKLYRYKHQYEWGELYE